MKIVYNKEGFVDFENPVYMEEDKFEKFTKFLVDLTKEKIEVKKVKEKERFVNIEGRHPQRWGAGELILLLDTKLSKDDLVKKLKRSIMSILMQKAQFVPEFISWAKSKGYDSNKISKTIIEQFLEEKDGNS